MREQQQQQDEIIFKLSCNSSKLVPKLGLGEKCYIVPGQNQRNDRGVGISAWGE